MDLFQSHRSRPTRTRSLSSTRRKSSNPPSVVNQLVLHANELVRAARRKKAPVLWPPSWPTSTRSPADPSTRLKPPSSTPHDSSPRSNRRTTRRIVMGEVLRHMACRCLSDGVGADAAAYLSPLQVGVAPKGGAESNLSCVTSSSLPSSSKLCSRTTSPLTPIPTPMTTLLRRTDPATI